MIADTVNTTKEIVNQISHHHLNMTKDCAKMVPYNPTEEEKDNRKDICSDIMEPERLTEESDLLTKVITFDETWFSRYKPEMKG